MDHPGVACSSGNRHLGSPRAGPALPSPISIAGGEIQAQAVGRLAARVDRARGALGMATVSVMWVRAAGASIGGQPQKWTARRIRYVAVTADHPVHHSRASRSPNRASLGAKVGSSRSNSDHERVGLGKIPLPERTGRSATSARNRNSGVKTEAVNSCGAVVSYEVPRPMRRAGGLQATTHGVAHGPRHRCRPRSRPRAALVGSGMASHHIPSLACARESLGRR